MVPGESDDRELSRQECLPLLTTEPYGRLALVRGGLPTVHPVNVVLDGGGIVIRTHRPAIPGPSPLPAVPTPA